MAKAIWENNGEPKDGEFAAVIDLENGSGVQRFTGKDHKEVADKLMEAQLNASQKISDQEKEIRKNATPDPAPAARRMAPKPLTANDRFQVAQDISDPATAPEAIRRVVESAIGGSLEEIAERLNEDEEASLAAQIQNEAYAFATETPDYHICDHNTQVITKYMEMHNLALTKKNFGIAFEQLRAVGLIVPKPTAAAAGEEPPAQPEEGSEQPGGLPPQPVSRTRPRLATMSSTGIRNQDVGGAAGTQVAKAKYTRQQIDAMSQSEYKDKYDNEPGFRQFVDSLK